MKIKSSMLCVLILIISAESGSASGGDAYLCASGVFFYGLVAGDYIATKKFVLLK
ncbi:MAG: hypothetical protein HY964_03935 [Ignavibacteriales bacterium]|nr:hypothetical protein [Ignavibacteriales bacterium]